MSVNASQGSKLHMWWCLCALDFRPQWSQRAITCSEACWEARHIFTNGVKTTNYYMSSRTFVQKAIFISIVSTF